MNNNSFDNIISFHIDNGAFRGRFSRLSKSIDTIVNKHKYPLPIAAALAETIGVASVLAASLKYDGLFTLQIQTKNAPISLIVVDVTSKGEIRAYAKYDEEHLKKAQAKRKMSGEIEPAPHLLGNGTLAFTVDQGKNTELYQGIVELKGKTIADCVLKYFKQSEQLDTAFRMYIEPPKKGSTFGWKVSTLMLQKMPTTGGKIDKKTSKEDMDNSWNEAVIFLNSLTDNEMIDENIDAVNLIHRLYHNNELTITNLQNMRFKCRCSEEKIINTIKSFEKAQIMDMIVDNKISVKCHFCSHEYIFEGNRLKTLIGG